MRVAAIGDAHLGRSYYSFTTEGGVNQREWDFERSFEAAVDLALAQEPDLMVWLGDIFDHPRPTYRSFRLAQRALARIRDHGLRAVVITGNHDTPRLPGTGSPYSALADGFPEMYFAHRLTYERFELPGLVVHAVPQMLTVEATLDALARGRPEPQPGPDQPAADPSPAHPGRAPLRRYQRDRGGRRRAAVRPRAARPLPLPHQGGRRHVVRRVDRHVLLRRRSGQGQGHRRARHRHRRPAATSRCRAAAAGHPGDGVRHRPVRPPSSRSWCSSGPSQVPEGAVARLYLDGVDPEAYRLLDLEAVRETARAALFLKLEPQFAAVGTNVELPEMDSHGRAVGALSGRPGPDRPGPRPGAPLGLEYLDRAVEAAG